jgi:uncharacterized membrane protein ArfB
VDFVIQWLWYLLAFVAGSAVAWVIAAVLIKRTGAEQDAAGRSEAGAGR